MRTDDGMNPRARTSRRAPDDASTRAPAPVRPRVSGEPILIVDDNAVTLKLMRLLLAGQGYAVRTAIDAEHATAVLEEFHPRLILMDLQMPGMDGLELTRRLKKDPALAQTVVVALTAYAMKGDEAKALEAGCDGYISKPIDTRALTATIAGYLQGDGG